MVENLPSDLIFIRDDARKAVPAAVRGLVDSIAEVGIINPLRVRPVRRMVNGALGDAWEVTAGVHRLHAARKLGLAEVPCIVVTDDDLHAELAMIDENLCRAELSPAERASATARRKELYEELHPETKHGGDEVAKLATSKGEPEQRFTAATAKVVGLSERAVQRDAERGEKVIPEVLAMVRGTSLDTGVYLDKIKKLPPNEQYAAARRDLTVTRTTLPKAPRPMDDAETEEQWLASIMRVWNRGAKEWRERFMAEIDPPTMDRRFA